MLIIREVKYKKMWQLIQIKLKALFQRIYEMWNELQ